MCCLHRICGIHHLERAVAKPWEFFDCIWFVIVSIGDVRPDDQLGQIFVIMMIIVAIILLPAEVCFGDQHLGRVVQSWVKITQG